MTKETLFSNIETRGEPNFVNRTLAELGSLIVNSRRSPFVMETAGSLAVTASGLNRVQGFGMELTGIEDIREEEALEIPLIADFDEEIGEKYYQYV